MMEKFVKVRTKIDVFILKHLVIMAFITLTATNPAIQDGIEWLLEKIEDFLEGPLNISYRVADNMADMIVIYALMVGSYKFITWSTKYIIKVIKNHKASKEVSE